MTRIAAMVFSGLFFTAALLAGALAFAGESRSELRLGPADQQAATSKPGVGAESSKEKPASHEGQQGSGTNPSEAKDQGAKATATGGGVNGEKARPKPDARGFVALGTVKFHPKRKEVEVEGYFNMKHGFLEFLACAPGAKSHESLVSIECNPEDLNTALLLMGLRKGAPPKSEVDLDPIVGDRVVISLRWQEKVADGTAKAVEKRVEDCILNSLVEETMERVGFVFTGSRFIEPFVPPPLPGEEKDAGKTSEEEKLKPVYAPIITGQYIALCHRPFAILDNPLQLPFPDASYYVYSDALPEIDREKPTPIVMVFRLPKEGDIDRSIKRMRVPPPGEEDKDEEDDSSKDR